jgi:hypothetical protein
MVAVMRKLLRVRDVVLTVNAEYIRSAAQADEFRTEPPFKLQGSYRNMNRIAERVLPVMNDAELDELIATNYRNDAQTLTTGAEANLLKFRELIGKLSDEDTARWNEIRQTFRRNQKLRGIDEGDRFGQAIAQLASFADGLSEIRETLAGGIDRIATNAAVKPGATAAADGIAERLDALRETLSTLATSLGDGLGQLAASATTHTPRHSADPELLRKLIESLRPAEPPVRVVSENGDVTSSASITVVNKIPPTLLNVLREQFRLMESWLRPVLLSSERQANEINELSRQIETCLAGYERLVGRIEATRESHP